MWRTGFAILLTVATVLAAGWLALRRSDIPYDTLEFAYSLPQSEFVTLEGGLKVHYTDTGPRDHPGIILVHGFAASLHTWTAWRSALETDFRVVTVDLPGHGLSRAETPDRVTLDRFSDVVLELADTLELPSFTLAGSSMGGAVAWITALKAPDRIDGLVLVGASGWASEGANERRPLAFKLLDNPVIRVLVRDLDMSAMVEATLRDSYVDQTFVTEELVQRYTALIRAPGHRMTLTQLFGGRPAVTAEALSVLDMPTLILWGREDNLVLVENADKFKAAIPQAELVIYDAVGHLPHEEVAADTLQEMREFMLSVELEALDERFIESAGDPRLDAPRPTP